MIYRATPPPLVPASLKNSPSVGESAADFAQLPDGAIPLGEIGDHTGTNMAIGASGVSGGKLLLNPQIEQILQVDADVLLSPEQRKQDAAAAAAASAAASRHSGDK